MDITPFIQAKSDQLNADDLIAGPITVQIEEVRRGSADQPVTIRISGGHMPFRPSKTALRIIAAAWGTDASAWAGRWMTLYRDASVKWGGAEVGGIRISHLSHIERAMTLQLAESRGKKRAWPVKPIKAPAQAGKATANLDKLLDDEGLTRADVDRWLHDRGRPTLDEAPDKVPALAGWLAADPGRIDQVRALIPDENDEPDTGFLDHPDDTGPGAIVEDGETA